MKLLFTWYHLLGPSLAAYLWPTRWKMWRSSWRILMLMLLPTQWLLHQQQVVPQRLRRRRRRRRFVFFFGVFAFVEVPSWKLTYQYPIPRHFWRWFSFSHVLDMLVSLEGMSQNLRFWKIPTPCPRSNFRKRFNLISDQLNWTLDLWLRGWFEVQFFGLKFKGMLVGWTTYTKYTVVLEISLVLQIPC